MYESAAGIGVCIAALLFVAYILTWLGQWAYAWMDDSEPANYNLLIKKIAFMQGYTGIDGDGDYVGHPKREWSMGCVPFLLAVLLSALLPMAVVLFLKFLFPALVALGFIAAAHLSRFCIRHKKLFNKHVANPNAHSNG